MSLLDKASPIHFLNFFILGLLFPNNYLGALVLGVLWELVETIAVDQPLSREILVDSLQQFQSLWDETNLNKLGDLFINILGYSLGSWSRNKVPFI